MGKFNALKTHCKRGHEFNVENTLLTPRDGRRICRACKRETRYGKPRAYDLRTKYGITPETYYALLDKQNGLCAICLGESPRYGRLSIDHNHSTGKVRGLLCETCNLALGSFNDDPLLLMRAAEYVA